MPPLPFLAVLSFVCTVQLTFLELQSALEVKYFDSSLLSKKKVQKFAATAVHRTQTGMKFSSAFYIWRC